MEYKMAEYKSKLHQTVSTTKTDYWNDSCSIEELTYAIENGAVGATTNPTIVVNVLKKEMNLWIDRIHELIDRNETWAESEVTWKLIEEMAVRGAELLKPTFDRTKGKKGRLSIQTDPTFYRNATAITDHAIHFNTLAPNMQVKAPVTRAGIKAIEEATFNGVSINATVCFTVPQALAVGEAIEHGLRRRETAGLPTETMSPVCTIMVGRTDDWMKAYAKREGISIDPEVMDWAGIACMKQAYRLFQERKYRTRLLAAAYRHLGHWSELIGGDIILTIPYEWQLKINESDIEVKERMQNPIDPVILKEMLTKIPEFRKAYEPNGLTIDEFDTYGATVRTLRGFVGSYHEVQGVVREIMLPNPDVKNIL
jgi:transaldolase